VLKDLEPPHPLAVACGLAWRKSVRDSGEYEQFAAECLRLSRMVKDAQNKTMFLQMAATWIKLAERFTANAEKKAA